MCWELPFPFSPDYTTAPMFKGIEKLLSFHSRDLMGDWDRPCKTYHNESFRVSCWYPKFQRNWTGSLNLLDHMKSCGRRFQASPGKQRYMNPLQRLGCLPQTVIRFLSLKSHNPTGVNHMNKYVPRAEGGVVGRWQFWIHHASSQVAAVHLFHILKPLPHQ